MDKLVDQLFIFHGAGDIQVFPGNYTEYRLSEDKRDFEKEIVENKIIEESKTVSDKNKIKLTYKERLELETLNKDIEKLETEKNKLTDLLQTVSTNHEELMNSGIRLTTVVELLDQKGNRWLELSEKEQQSV